MLLPLVARPYKTKKWTKCWINLKTWPLRSCVFELVSHVATRYAFFSFQTCRGMFFVSFLCHTLTNTFRTQQRYRGPGSISSSYCGSFCLSDYLKHKIKCWSKWQPSHRSVLQSSLAPLVFLYFGLHFRLVTYLCRNRFPDTMLYMAVVAKTAVTTKFDLRCRHFFCSARRHGQHAWRPH